MKYFQVVAAGCVLTVGMGMLAEPAALALSNTTSSKGVPLAAPKAKNVSYSVLPMWYAVRVRKSNSTSSAVVGSVRPRQKVMGTVSTAWPGWLRTASGYVSLAGLNTITGKSPRNGVAATLKLCAIPLQYNTVRKVFPNYSPKTPRYYNCDALASLNALEAAYKKKFGHWAQIDLAFRSYAEQEYWYRKYGYPTAAKPGTSNHGWGLAIDFSDSQGGGKEFTWGGPGFNWLKANGASFGMNSPFAYGTYNESYHWDFLG